MGVSLITEDNAVQVSGKTQLLTKIFAITRTMTSSEIAELLGVVQSFAQPVRQTKLRAQHGSSLTEREMEVLVLVANGYSRRAIGLSLSISMNTAARHIANIYAKLGVSSVAEATQWALSHGLVASSVPHHAMD